MGTRASFFYFVILLGWAQSAHAEPTIFWRRPEVYRRIESERYIAVSARTETLTQAAKTVYEMKIVTAGHISAPLDFTYEQLMKFEDYTKVSSNFRELKYDAIKKTLFVHGEALGFHAQMYMDLEFQDEGSTRKILWSVKSGTFYGMKGDILIQSVTSLKTEISMSSLYQSPTLPLPRILMGVGLEIVAHRVAGLMRSHVESRYKEVSKKP